MATHIHTNTCKHGLQIKLHKTYINSPVKMLKPFSEGHSKCLHVQIQ